MRSKMEGHTCVSTVERNLLVIERFDDDLRVAVHLVHIT